MKKYIAVAFTGLSLVSSNLYAGLENATSSVESTIHNPPPAQESATSRDAGAGRQPALLASPEAGANAPLRLAKAFLNGEGTEANYQQALQWFRVAAQNGNLDAMVYIGDMYRLGKGIAQNYDEALKRYRATADQGNPLGQFNLHRMYFSGYGVLMDKKVALQWLRKAAEGGLAIAQTRLGKMYKAGMFVQRDLQEAVKWFTAAADQGNVEAQFQLAKIYAMGMGGKKDYLQSYVWLQIVMDDCRETAYKQQCLDYLSSVSSSLSADQMKKAHQLLSNKRQHIASAETGEKQGVTIDW